MSDFFGSLDPGKLVWAEVFLSFIIVPYDSAPKYNLPIFLFGLIANELPEATTPLQAFTAMCALSIVWDIVYFALHGQNWFIRMISIIIQLLKVPTAIAYGLSLRKRGATPSFGGMGNFRGGDLNGPTVWSMPGGFSDRGGYQTVDEEPSLSTPTRPAAPQDRQQPPQPGTGTYQGV